MHFTTDIVDGLTNKQLGPRLSKSDLLCRQPHFGLCVKFLVDDIKCKCVFVMYLK